MVNELLNYVKRHVGKVENFVNIPNKVGESSLHLAARKQKNNNLSFPGEDLQIIKLLMENGSDVFVDTNEVRYNIIFDETLLRIFMLFLTSISCYYFILYFDIIFFLTD